MQIQKYVWEYKFLCEWCKNNNQVHIVLVETDEEYVDNC